MRKIAACLTTTAFLLSTSLAYAAVDFPAPQGPLDIRTGRPGAGIDPNTAPGTVIGNAVTIAIIVAAVVVLFFIIYGAFLWITSGGDKEKVKNARGAIVHALIGLALIALAYLIVRIVGQILQIDILNLPALPTLGPKATPT